MCMYILCGLFCMLSYINIYAYATVYVSSCMLYWSMFQYKTAMKTNKTWNILLILSLNSLQGSLLAGCLPIKTRKPKCDKNNKCNIFPSWNFLSFFFVVIYRRHLHVYNQPGSDQLLPWMSLHSGCQNVEETYIIIIIIFSLLLFAKNSLILLAYKNTT